MTQYYKTMDEKMEMPYAISLVGLRPEIVTRSLIAQARSVKTLVLFHYADPLSTAAANSISTTSHTFGMKVVKNQIEDAFNFFEVILAAEHVCSKFGEPAWVNAADGLGLGVSALTTFASVHGVDLVTYNEDRNETSTVHLALLNELLLAGVKFNRLLENVITNEDRSIEQICSDLQISRSTASRQLKELRRLDLVSISGSGRGRSPFRISMTAWGRTFCRYSGIDRTS